MRTTDVNVSIFSYLETVRSRIEMDKPIEVSIYKISKIYSVL